MNIQELFDKYSQGKPKGKITASTASHYHKSPFRIWADAFAPKEKKDPESPYQNLLFERGSQHEKKVVSSLFPDSKEFTYDTIPEGFKLILNSMAEGITSIHNAPLMLISEDLYGVADVLERRPGKSIFGDYHYVIKEIKLAKNIKDNHIIQGAFYNYIIGKIQDYLPKSFYLINHDEEEFEFKFTDYEEKLVEAILGTKNILEGLDKPSACFNGIDWPWNEYSNELAVKNQDVSLVTNLGYAKQRKLHSIGINSLNDLKNAPADKVIAIKGVAKPTYDRWMLQTDSILDQKSRKIKPPVFPNVKTEIYFDIEGDPELEIDYLYGCLVKHDNKETFHYFWADKPEEEKQLWEDFCSYIRELPQGDFVLYYYTRYEARSINKMATKYGCDEELLKKIKSHMVDLYPIISKSFVLPLYSYSIKYVAKWLGFKWRADDAGGDNSIEWYSQYLDGKKEYKQKLLEYNEDDVKATLVLKEWMENQ